MSWRKPSAVPNCASFRRERVRRGPSSDRPIRSVTERRQLRTVRGRRTLSPPGARHRGRDKRPQVRRLPKGTADTDQQHRPRTAAVDLADHVENFRRRVLQDAVLEAESAYWLCRAEPFEAARPQRREYIGGRRLPTWRPDRRGWPPLPSHAAATPSSRFARPTTTSSRRRRRAARAGGVVSDPPVPEREPIDGAELLAAVMALVVSYVVPAEHPRGGGGDVVGRRDTRSPGVRARHPTRDSFSGQTLR